MGVPLTLSSVPSTTPYIQYVATSNQTVFPYPFPITQDADLIVVVNGVTLVTDNGYTLSGQGQPNGGNLTFTLGQTAGTIVTLYRNIAIQRITQIGQNSGYSSTTLNAEFNNLYLIAQQLQEATALCLQIPNTNNPAPATTLTPGAYANKYLSFDANGNPTPAALTSVGTLTQAILAGLLTPQTPQEAAQGITPPNLFYPPGNVLRYGSNSVPGTTDMTTAITNAIACNTYVWIPDGKYLVTSEIHVDRSNVTIAGSGRTNASSVAVAGYGAYIIYNNASAGSSVFSWKDTGSYVGIELRDFGISMPTAGRGNIGIKIGQALYVNIRNLWIQGTGTTSDDQIGIQLDGALPAGGFGYTGVVNIEDCLFANLLTGVNSVDSATTGVVDGTNIRGCSFQGSANHTSNRGVFFGRQAFACTVKDNTFLGQWIGIDTLGRGIRQSGNYYENDFPPPGVLAWRWQRGSGNSDIENTAFGEWRNSLSYTTPNNGVDSCTVQTQSNVLFDNAYVEAALGFREFGRNFNIGRYTTPAFSAANFTSNAGTWTVASAVTYEFTIVGKKMTVAFFVAGTAAGAGSELRIAIPPQTLYGTPTAVSANARTRNPIHTFQNSAYAIGIAEVQVGDTFIRCYKDATVAGGWTNGDCEVYGEITFEIA